MPGRNINKIFIYQTLLFLVFALLYCVVPINSLTCVTSSQAFYLGSVGRPASLPFSYIFFMIFRLLLIYFSTALGVKWSFYCLKI